MSDKDKSGSQAQQDSGLGNAPSLPALSPVYKVPLWSQWAMPWLTRTQSQHQWLASPESCQPPWCKGALDASWYHPQQIQTCCPNRHEVIQLFQLEALKYPSNMH